MLVIGVVVYAIDAGYMKPVELLKAFSKTKSSC